jgi:rabenosyn-5
MSARKLGGGRILGSGKGLAPPTPPTNSIQRAASLFAPSESTLSMNSSSPSPPASGILPQFGQDLTSNISLGGPSAAAVGSKLVCPICDEEMVSIPTR